MPLVCKNCGNPTRTVIYQKSGDGFCPDCHRLATESEHSSAVFRDDIPGGIVVENYGPHPIRFDSHSERRHYMAEHGLREREKFSPMPGTDIDPQGIPNPKGYLDPYTLESAAILLSRNGRKASEEDAPSLIHSTFTGQMEHRDAVAVAEGGDKARQSRMHRRTDGHHSS